MSVKFDFTGLDQPFAADWPVKVNVPQDGGKTVEQEFTARFLLLDKAKIDELTADATNPDAYLHAFFVGLPGDQVPEGKTFEEMRALMLARPNVRMALIKAFSGFQAGIAVKN